ncbi:MAG TPA: YggS family pyridoxal phosphate-dependent enzyme [Blastocatellia bacterium]|nr:YggS family pyridoxal phosphate-dependent enzyme [Blastocatellia bacterium]
MNELAERIESVRHRIAEALHRAGREAEKVRLIAVTKTVPVERIQEAIEYGVKDFGENRVQEAEKKISYLPQEVCWHFIGHLQSNKVRKAVPLFDWIQSVDSVHLAERLNRTAAEAGRRIPVLIQVALDREPTKHGIAPEDLGELARALASMPHLDVRGLMAIPPFFEDPQKVRPYFRKLAELLRDLNEQAIFSQPLTELSMGMSHDFEIAVEEGATMVRIGTAIFGERQR